MKRKIELLAPCGDVESVKAAIVAGADARPVTLGSDQVNYPKSHKLNGEIAPRIMLWSYF
jgi:collagenase-like PrtC family protease